MQEDYLWNRTGSDPEIERLENALRAFRYQETDAPALLPAKIVRPERKTPRNFFRLAFAFASGAALIAVCFGVWLQVSGEKIAVVADSPATIGAPVAEKIAVASPIEKPDDLIVKKVETAKQKSEPKSVKANRIVRTIARRDTTIAEKVGVKRSVVLTKNERYAYDRLMLALSITGSKLKIVEDKIHGADAPAAAAALENGR